MKKYIHNARVILLGVLLYVCPIWCQQPDSLSRELSGDLRVEPSPTEKEAERLYNQYLTELYQHDISKAADNLILRSQLDTTNVQWALDAAQFINIYMADSVAADKYINMALRNALSLYGEENELTISCYEMVLANHPKERLSMAKKALDLAIKLYGSEDVIPVASRYNNLGLAYFATDSLDWSQKCFEKSIDIYIKNNNEEYPNLSSSYHNLGAACIKKHNYDEGLKYLYIAKEKRETSNDANLYRTYHDISAVYSKTERYDSAFVYSYKALEACRKFFPEGHFNIVQILTDINSELQNMSEYNFVIDYCEKELSRDDMDSTIRARTNYVIGSCYFRKGETANALPHFLKTVNILKDSGKEKLLVADACHNAATIYYGLADYEQAQIYEQDAILYSREADEDNPQLADYYGNAGLIQAMLGKYEQALSYFDEANSLYKTTIEDSCKIGETIFNKAAAYYDLGQEQNAIAQLKNSLNIYSAIVERKQDIILPKIIHLYEVIVMKSSYTEYIDEYKEMMLAIQDVLRKMDETKYQYEISAISLDLGNMYFSNNRLDESISVYTFLLEQLTDEKMIAIVRMNLANVYIDQKRLPEAESLYLSALQFFQGCQECNEYTATVLRHLGMVCFKTQRYEEELKYYLMAEPYLLETDPSRLVKLYDDISTCYQEMGNFSKSLEYNKKSLDLLLGK